MRMKLVFATVVAVMLLTAGSALAGDGGPGTGAVGAGPTQMAFSCERATARLARVEGRIAKIQARIDSGQAKRPELAAKRTQRLEKRAERIEARIAAKC